MVGSFGFGHESLFTFNEDCFWVLDFPLTDVGEGLPADRSLFGRFGGRPTFRPAICELFDKRRQYFRCLRAD